MYIRNNFELKNETRYDDPRPKTLKSYRPDKK